MRYTIALLAVLLAACGSGAPNTLAPTPAPERATPAPERATPAPERATPTPAAAVFTIGDRVQVGDQQYIELVEAARWSSTNQFIQPDPGHLFVTFLVRFEGLSPTGSSYNPFYFNLVDNEGFEYRTSFLGRDPSLGSSNDLMPGQRAQGWLTFEVPTTTQFVILVYRPTLGLAGDPVRFGVRMGG